MSMKLHPDVVAWWAWIRSSEGFDCMAGNAQGLWLENRLWRAFMAGRRKVEKETHPHAVHSIGWAIKQMHGGLRVSRAGWNGKNMWLALQVPDKHSKMTQPYVYMSTAQGDLVPWLASQTDLLATDWDIASGAHNDDL